MIDAIMDLHAIGGGYYSKGGLLLHGVLYFDEATNQVGATIQIGPLFEEIRSTVPPPPQMATYVLAQTRYISLA